MTIAAQPAAAASVHAAQSELCDLRLEGAIDDGDTQRIEAALAGKAGVRLCLNSEGGSYAEALKIIDMILASKTLVGTVIDRDHVCLSACSLVFLAGHRKSETDRADRKMHVSARLGFHGPWIPGAASTSDAAQLQRAQLAGIRAIGRLIASSQTELFPHSLLAAALEKDSDEYLMIENIDAVGAWNIGLLGYKRPTALTGSMVLRACRNHERWRIWNGSPASDMEFTEEPKDPRLKRPVAFQKRRYRAMLKDFGDEMGFLCGFDAFDAGARGIFIDMTIVSERKEMPRADALEQAVAKGGAGGAPLWYVYHPTTALKSLAE